MFVSEIPSKRSISIPWALVALACLVVVLIVLATLHWAAAAHHRTPPGPAPDSYLFCFWNTENFFDDQLDERRPPDKTYDKWFATDKEALRQKLSKLSKVLAEMNDGRGPDIIALAELESKRSAELLRDALNEQLDESLRYSNVVYHDPKGGRNIATGIITRLDVDFSGVKLVGHRLRILRVPVEAEGKTLIVVASHWKSRLPEKGDPTGEAGREKYGDTIYNDFLATYKRDPKVAYLVCGDFNDDPTDASVTDHLYAIGDRDKVLAGDDGPWLFNPFVAVHAKGGGSHFYKRFYQFDQICLSPALLDGSRWQYVPESAATVARIADSRGRPNRFGNPSDKRPYSARGASDHFPVTVRLKVRP
jgi:endonuclease/exonuclease/phosphatase family metal-dependent hydrolase